MKPYPQHISKDANRRKHTAKELTTDFGINTYDFTARSQYPMASRFDQPDKKSGDYTWLSPYIFCAADPINFSDPTGMRISDNSRADWDMHKAAIRDRIQSLGTEMDNSVERAKKEGLPQEKQDAEIAMYQLLLSFLGNSLKTMKTLENSEQVYSLKQMTEYGDGLGGVTKNTTTGEVVIKYLTQANFVHEMTHAGQVETGDIAFGDKGLPVFQDLYDEVAAYRHQYAFDPASVSLLPSDIRISSINGITANWVWGIKDYDGNPVYQNKQYKIGKLPINVNSTMSQLLQAYSWLNE